MLIKWMPFTLFPMISAFSRGSHFVRFRLFMFSVLRSFLVTFVTKTDLGTYHAISLSLIFWDSWPRLTLIWHEVTRGLGDAWKYQRRDPVADPEGELQGLAAPLQWKLARLRRRRRTTLCTGRWKLRREMKIGAPALKAQGRQFLPPFAETLSPV